MTQQVDKPWKAIAAMAENRVIGDHGRIPWNLPEDFKWVKQCTQSQSIAMGRKTYESIGRPLPGRENIVITRSVQIIPGCTVLPSLEALERHPTAGEVWIFGGSEIYRQALPKVHELMLTVVYGNFEGDACFPPFEHLFGAPEVIRQESAFEIRRYRTNG